MKKTVVGEYTLYAAKTGQKIRRATMVTFPDGQVVKFLDKFTSKKRAVRHALEHLEKRNFDSTEPDLELRLLMTEPQNHRGRIG